MCLHRNGTRPARSCPYVYCVTYLIRSTPLWNLLSNRFAERSLPGSDGSTKQAIDLRQELDEVELGRASGTGGVEVGSLPVSLFLRELGIGFAGPTAGI